jgi:phospholipid transport system substrate-binding protein
MKTKGLRSLLAAVALLAVAAPAMAAGAGPKDQLRQSNERIDKLLKDKRLSDDKAVRRDVKNIVDGFLDYSELARRALAKHWNELSPAQRDEYVKTFRELLQKNYVKQLRTNLDYDVNYKEEKVEGTEATVSTEVKVRTKGKSTDVAIDYKMRQVGDKWMVYDVITDGTSMLANYRQQFHNIITKDGFDALLQKMKKKVNALDETGQEKPEGAGETKAEPKTETPGDKGGKASAAKNIKGKGVAKK